MTYKDKLIDLLKSDDETREAMEKLEFGCEIEIEFLDLYHYESGGYDNEGTRYQKIIGQYIGGEIGPRQGGGICGDFMFKWDGEIFDLCSFGENGAGNSFEIIGLPLQERFIRMYCENKGIYICITTSGFICGVDIDKPYCRLDNTKDFDNQSEETYMAIFNALISIK